MTEQTTTPDTTAADLQDAVIDAAEPAIGPAVAEDTTPAAFAAAFPELDAALALYRGDSADDPDAAAERVRFTPGYPVQAGTRILRSRLYANPSTGVATADFEGTLQGQPWIEGTRAGGLKLYAEVAVDRDTLTTLHLALVPTGKRVPEAGIRLGGANGTWAYLLGQDVTSLPELKAEDAAADQG